MFIRSRGCHRSAINHACTIAPSAFVRITNFEKGRYIARENYGGCVLFQIPNCAFSPLHAVSALKYLLHYCQPIIQSIIILPSREPTPIFKGVIMSPTYMHCDIVKKVAKSLMVYDIASPYFGVRKQGGNTFTLPGGVFCLFFLFSFSLDVFRVMTPRSWESLTNPLDRREELNVTVFFSSNRHRLKKCRMC